MVIKLKNNARNVWRKKDIESINTDFVHVPLYPEPNKNTTPYEYFKQFVTPEKMESLAFQTNLYSAQRNGSSMDVSPNEIEEFMGVYFRMGLVELPSQRSYWEQDLSYNGDVM